MEDSLEDYMDEEVSRLLERYRQESLSRKFGFYDVDEYVSLIEAYIWQADFKKAKEVLSIAKEQYPDAAELTVKEAEICLETDRFDQALLLLLTVERVDPYLYDCYIVKGHTLLCMNRLEEARKSFEVALNAGADRVDVAMGLARVEIEKGNTEKAWEYTRQVIGTDDDNIESCNRFIDLAQRGDKLPEAMELVRNLLKKNPYSVLYWKTMVELATMAACYEQALEACEFVLTIVPDDWETNVNKFYLLENADITDDTQMPFLKQMERMAIARKDEAMLLAVRFRIAYEYEIEFEWEKSGRYYNLLLDNPVSRQYALFRLGVLADFCRDYRLSLRYFEEALQTHGAEDEPGNRGKIYRGMARTYDNMDTNHADECLECGRMAIATDPEDRFHLYAYVQDAVQLNRVREAYDYLAARYNGEERAEWMLAKAVLFYYMERTEEAYGLFLQAFESDFVYLLTDMPEFFLPVLRENPQVKEYFEKAEARRSWEEKAVTGFLQPPFYYGPENSFMDVELDLPGLSTKKRKK